MNMELNSPLSPIDFLHTSKLLRIAVTDSINPMEHYGVRAHRDCEVCLVKEGLCIMNVAGNDIPLAEGDFIFILPYISHSFKTPDGSSCQVFHLHFNLDFLNSPLYQIPKLLNIDLWQYFILYAGHYIHGHIDFQLEACIENIAHEFQSNQNSFVTMLNYYVFELTLLLSRRLHAEDKSKKELRNPYVEQAIQYIHAHYNEPLTNASIADQLLISERYLSKLFYKYTRSTVQDYLNSYRINQSVLLMTKGHSITDIALHVGFSSPPHYTKVFKKYMGLAPNEYRKTLMKSMD